MTTPTMNDTITQDAALTALREYKLHRSAYDDRDWEIERIYRQISKGKTVISLQTAIVSAGLDGKLRPKLAIVRADCELVIMDPVSHGVECRSAGRE
jgi:hypothetical protein